MLATVALLLLPLVHAHTHNHAHEHVSRQILPDAWAQPRDHAVHALFARADFPAVGSDAWTASLPPFTTDGSHTPDITKLPQAWVDAYNAAKTAGKIPTIPQSTTGGQYPNNLDPMGTEVCSSYIGCRAAEDHFNAPDGMLALNFDDGPTEVTGELLDFLKTNNEIATHFVIGYSIQQNVSAWEMLLNSGHDLACHTCVPFPPFSTSSFVLMWTCRWSHPQLTTLSDMQIVSELGWSMNVIYLSTNGRVPRFWRPPTGDADNRVRAIAKYVFGMEMMVWNQDTEDWSLTETPAPTSQAKIASQMTTWLNGAKSPGLMILEHELSELSVGSFKAAYPLMKSAGWQTGSAARLTTSAGAYRNAAGPSGDVTAANLIDFAGTGPSASGGAVQASGSASGSAAPSGSGKSSSAASKPTGSTSASASGSSSSSAESGSPTSGAVSLRTSSLLAAAGLGLSVVVFL
ncbi:carbohydrate esterase family 4 protein [Roridomyces roridus]|uniref:chitin deacetylase n=1 Tax=Roridomyces roridus TaxID=1738132 RepID=A0AAD7BPG6_9AGAR|nr:carbohydrate esterase family 4 protein [Roridomyces roridus]